MTTAMKQAPESEARAVQGLIAAPYVHACCYSGCTCKGRLARYIPGDPETFIASRPYSARELRHQAWAARRAAR